MGRCPQQSTAGSGVEKGDPLVSIFPLFYDKGVICLRVVMLNKKTMTVTQVDNVTNISATGNTFVLTVSGGTASYAMADWYLSVLWI